jgi:hypothetical protein
MAFSFLSSRIVVGTSATQLVAFYPREVSSIMIRANGAMYIGSGGVSTSSGHYMDSNDSFVISHLDFNLELLKANPLIRIYAVASSETTANVTSIRR